MLLEKLASASQVKVKLKGKLASAAQSQAKRRRLAVVPNGALGNGAGVAVWGDQFSNSLILIGASTGGTEAIREVLATLPLDLPQFASCSISLRSFPLRLPRACSKHVPGLWWRLRMAHLCYRDMPMWLQGISILRCGEAVLD